MWWVSEFKKWFMSKSCYLSLNVLPWRKKPHLWIKKLTRKYPKRGPANVYAALMYMARLQKKKKKKGYENVFELLITCSLVSRDNPNPFPTPAPLWGPCLMRSLPVSSLSSWCHGQGQCHSLLKSSTLLDQTLSLLHKRSRWRGRDREGNPFIHTEMKFKPLLFYTVERMLMWIHFLLIF